MEQAIISPETIMELMAERSIMPEDVYQDLISHEGCQKHKRVLSATTIFVIKILKSHNVKLNLDSILILSARYYLALIEIIAN